MNCLIYARVSTGAQADRKLSIPAQLAAMRQYASHHGWLIVEEFLEAGVSGRNADRPELGRMLAGCRQKPPITFVLVHKVDRLARNLADHLAIRSYLHREGVKLASVIENLDDSLSGQLVERILASLAEFYSGNLGQEVRKGLAERVRQGGWPHLHPVGYRRGTPDVAGYRRIELDPTTAPVVRRAFELMATGQYHSLQIVSWLREHQVPSSREGIRRLLRNPFYCGRLRWKGNVFSGTHPPLVSTELFDLVQEQLRRRQHLKHRRRVPSLLQGIGVCAECRTLLASEDHGGRTYYRCRGSLKKPRCRARYPNSAVVHASLLDLYERLSCSPDLHQRLVQLIRQQQESEQRRIAWCAELAAGDQMAWRAKEERLARALADGSLEPEVYRALVEEGRTRLQVASPEQSVIKGLPTLLNGSTVWDLHRQLRPAHRRELVRLLFDQIAVNHLGVVNYVLRQPGA